MFTSLLATVILGLQGQPQSDFPNQTSGVRLQDLGRTIRAEYVRITTAPLRKVAKNQESSNGDVPYDLYSAEGLTGGQPVTFSLCVSATAEARS